MRFLQRWTSVLGLLAIGLAAAVVTAGAEEPVIANLELMSKLTAEVLEELLDAVPREIIVDEVTLVPYVLDERYEFIDNVFARILTDRGYKVYASQAAMDSVAASPNRGVERGLVLEYQALDFDLSYPKIYRTYLIGGKKVKRSANIKLLAKLLDPNDDAVLWVGEASRSYNDQFAYGLLPQVEAGLFAFNKPPRESAKWGKFVEPVVVSGIIVGLIYLFFSNQTDS